MIQTKILQPLTIIIIYLLITTTSSYASEQFEIYGRANMSYEDTDIEGNHDSTEWKSNASRLGVRGQFQHTESLTWVYQLEQEVDLAESDVNKDNTFNTRDSFLGAEDKNYGTFRFGAMNTPLKQAQGKVDQFNDLSADIKNLVAGDVRTHDSYRYDTPAFNGNYVFSAQHAPSDSKFGSSQSYSLVVKSNDLYTAFAIDNDMRKNDKPAAETKVYDSIRAVVQYTIGAWKLGSLIEKSERQDVAGADKETAYIVSSAYTNGKNTYKAQIGHSDITADSREQYALGIDHHFRKNIKVYTYYVKQSDNVKPGQDEDIFAIGGEVKF